MAVTRRGFLAACAAWAAAASAAADPRHAADARSRPAPSPAQLRWQQDELALFLHFGVNTFTDREWGDGREDPAIFAPGRFDPRQWTRAARAGGFRAAILTAKHHDGFCLWPTRTTSHSVARTAWRGGAADVVGEFVNACRADGLRPGVYLSPWDRNNPLYGDSPRYNDLYCEQLTELLTRYGEMAEVWFDGANGEGPNGKRQQYDWPRVFSLVRRLQPRAVMFSDAGPDVRWCGNEKGDAGEPNWSTVDPDAVPYPGATGEGIESALRHGDPNGRAWRPPEADTSIRPGWFHHASEDDRVRTVDQLTDLYFRSVGRNSKLLLNVPPTRDGLLHATDVSRMAAFQANLRAVFSTDLAKGRRPRWRSTGPATSEGEIDLGRDTSVSIVRLEEDIRRGQRVARYTLSGWAGATWQVLSRGTTIGYARLDRFEPATVRRLRVTIDEAVAAPLPLTIRAFA
jgi:alpha-L-fucosidase